MKHIEENADPLFDPSMMVHFRERFPVEEVAKINEYVYTGKWPEKQRNVDRNDNGDEPPVPSGGEGENGDKASEHKGKVNPNTSKKKKALMGIWGSNEAPLFEQQMRI